MSKHNNKPVALAAALIGGLALSSSAFAMSDLTGGYMLGAQHAEAAEKAAEGKCGEGKCGGDASHSADSMDSDHDGSISQAEFAAAHDGDASNFARYDANSDGMISADELKAAHEGKCGEGKCGDAKTEPAAAKANMEGKCGEGKCGGSA
ncbi:EF-hand domain-containing protein [Lysobacter sp. D1-1-M9]|uniref:EF-hand domain-containing protein n=2 Tax=Novilysobacter TaxID=3382699 RepID=UPI002FCA8AF2